MALTAFDRQLNHKTQSVAKTPLLNRSLELVHTLNQNS